MLGLNIGSHDSGVAFLTIRSPKEYFFEVYQSERFSKVKHQGDFPFIPLKRLQEDYGKRLQDLPADEVASNAFFMSSSELEKAHGKNPRYQEFIKTFGFEKFSTLFNHEIAEPPHHLCHAYTAWGFSPFEKALVLVYDGCGSKRGEFKDYLQENDIGPETEGDYFETLSVYLLNEGTLTPAHKEWTTFEKVEKVDHFIGDSLGNLFSLSASRIFGEWKESGNVMGLAAFGQASPIQDKVAYQRQIIEGDFKVYKGKKNFDHQPEEDFKRSADIAASVQAHFEKEVLKLCHSLKTKYPDYENLILVGGCALNCLTNIRLVDEQLFKNVFVPPFPNDEGIAMGAALFLAHQKKKITFRTINPEAMTAYLGRKKSGEVTKEEIEQAFPGFEIRPWLEAAEVLARGEVVAIFQGPSEVGPRSLGNRSLLVRPDAHDIKKYLNENIKFREDFRPYGATVLQEDVDQYFVTPRNFCAPFMTFAPKVLPEKREYLKGVTHEDGTCRMQTITRLQNPRYYDLIAAFKKLTDESVILNTSLNRMGQPILEDLKDAQAFMTGSKVNYLVVNDWLLVRK